MTTPSRHVHHFVCRLTWTGASQGPTKTFQGYSREWRAEFDDKPTLTGSAAPSFRGDGSKHNPEDLLMAALSSCHCLSYLALCARAGIEVLDYQDEATGTMQHANGKIRFTEVVLRPRVVLSPGADLARAVALHTDAHAECFIASSVNFPVRNEPEVSLAER